ncbi:MAG: 50S ribosomal protein L15 [SAR86 cluster bacterium]|jgi:large subunit ribosomal protein L15|nr:50S ribosomal protein L15 [SAR86 cluster bacterium]|tara:strand:- start:1875 stop:2333 length:459 start_codon:yes stop_codon:yes gene_type:complete
MKLYTLKLNNLIPHKSLSSRTSKRKRRGRGPGSGLGKTSGRGHKGQGSRSGGGVRAGFEGGQMPLQKRVPKYGFFSRKSRFSEEIRLSTLIKLDKKEINIQVLKEEDLINQNTSKVKVIKDTESCSKLNLKGINTTASVKNLIESAGGKIEV